MQKSVFRKTIEIIIFIVFIFFLFAPLLSLGIWSVALRWYWPNTLPIKLGHCHYCSYNNHGNCHSGRLFVGKA